MSDIYLIRIKIAPEDGLTHNYMGTIPKRFRGYEIKRILSSYLNDSGVAPPPAALALPSKDKDVKSSTAKKKNTGTSQREVSEF